MSLTAGRIDQLRRNATRLKKADINGGFTHRQALDIVAIAEGFKDWRDLEKQTRTDTRPRGPGGSQAFKMGGPPQQELEDLAAREGFKDWAQVASLMQEVGESVPTTARHESARRLFETVLIQRVHIPQSALAALQHPLGFLGTDYYLSGRSNKTNRRRNA